MDPDPIRILIRSTELHCTIPHIQLSLFMVRTTFPLVSSSFHYSMEGNPFIAPLRENISYRVHDIFTIEYGVVKGMIKTHEYLKVREENHTI
jgi:hypothetical protein